MTTATAAAITIDEAVQDKNLLGAALGGELATWSTWRTVLKAAFGNVLTSSEANVFGTIAGGRAPPVQRVRELWAIIGRRSGKSRVAALIGAYIAGLIDHRAKLSPGEVGTVLILAASKPQAQTVFSYAKAFFDESPLLKQLVEETTADEIRLRGNIVLSIHTCSYRTVRGRTLLACIFDEVGFWRDENSAAPDLEVYRAVLPALATTGGMLIAISSPYAQRGLLYQKYQKCFAKPDPNALVIQAPTVAFNPTIDTAVIEQAKADDPEAARAEWEAAFRGDLQTFVDRAVVEACVSERVRERPFEPRHRYFAHVDPSGGQNDSFALALAHREGERQVLDLVAEWKSPFSPNDVVDDIAKILQRYRCNAVTGDAYAAQWVVDAFRLHRIAYRHEEKNRSELFLSLLPLLTSQGAVLLDLPGLVGQISQLERRTGRSGRDTVDHMRGAHDDIAVAAAGALVQATAMRGTFESFRRRHDARPERAVVGHQAIKERLYGRGRSTAPQSDWRLS